VQCDAVLLKQEPPAASFAQYRTSTIERTRKNIRPLVLLGIPFDLVDPGQYGLKAVDRDRPLELSELDKFILDPRPINGSMGAQLLATAKKAHSQAKGELVPSAAGSSSSVSSSMGGVSDKSLNSMAGGSSSSISVPSSISGAGSSSASSMAASSAMGGKTVDPNDDTHWSVDKMVDHIERSFRDAKRLDGLRGSMFHRKSRDIKAARIIPIVPDFKYIGTNDVLEMRFNADPRKTELGSQDNGSNEDLASRGMDQSDEQAVRVRNMQGVVLRSARGLQQSSAAVKGRMLMMHPATPVEDVSEFSAGAELQYEFGREIRVDPSGEGADSGALFVWRFVQAHEEGAGVEGGCVAYTPVSGRLDSEVGMISNLSKMKRAVVEIEAGAGEERQVKRAKFQSTTF
jgi:hypothetical protein